MNRCSHVRKCVTNGPEYEYHVSKTKNVNIEKTLGTIVDSKIGSKRCIYKNVHHEREIWGSVMVRIRIMHRVHVQNCQRTNLILINNFLNEKKKVSRRLQWLKHLPCKHENLSSNPLDPHKKQDTVTPFCSPCNLVAGWETDRRIPRRLWTSGFVLCNWDQELLPQTRWKARTDTWSPLTSTCMPIITHTNIHT